LGYNSIGVIPDNFLFMAEYMDSEIDEKNFVLKICGSVYLVIDRLKLG
jgi:hypothetical protein